MKFKWLALFIVLSACQETPEPTLEPVAAGLTRTPSPDGAAVYFVSPHDSARVPAGMVEVIFGLSGMEVVPAGVDSLNTGHHHLLVNASEWPPLGQPIPADSVHLHFGLGQTETTLDLSPGTYTLQLLLGDYLHIPHDPPVYSERITLIVE